MDTLDPIRLDQQLRRAMNDYRTWRRLLRTQSLESDTPNPLSKFRSISTKEAFRNAKQLPNIPTKTALVRWVTALAIERTTIDDLVAAEESRNEEVLDSRLGKRRWPVRALVFESVLGADPHWRNVAAASLSAHAIEASESALWWQGRRHGASLALGANGLEKLEVPSTASALEIADAILAGTAALTREVIDTSVPWNEVLATATAADALHGWPARLSPRWLRELWGTSAAIWRLPIDLGPLPAAACGGSYARALARFGAAVCRAVETTQQRPFAAACWPFDARPYSHGTLFASLLLTPSFLRKRLGLARSQVDSHVQSFSRLLLIALRIKSIQLAVAHATSPQSFRDLHASYAKTAIGSTIPIELAGVIPRYAPEAPSIVVGILDGLRWMLRMRDRFDEDWFDNPLAQQYLLESIWSDRLILPREQLDDQVGGAVGILGASFS